MLFAGRYIQEVIHYRTLHWPPEKIWITLCQHYCEQMDRESSSYLQSVKTTFHRKRDDGTSIRCARYYAGAEMEEKPPVFPGNFFEFLNACFPDDHIRHARSRFAGMLAAFFLFHPDCIPHVNPQIPDILQIKSFQPFDGQKIRHWILHQVNSLAQTRLRSVRGGNNRKTRGAAAETLRRMSAILPEDLFQPVFHALQDCILYDTRTEVSCSALHTMAILSERFPLSLQEATRLLFLDCLKHPLIRIQESAGKALAILCTHAPESLLKTLLPLMINCFDDNHHTMGVASMHILGELFKKLSGDILKERALSGLMLGLLANGNGVRYAAANTLRSLELWLSTDQKRQIAEKFASHLDASDQEAATIAADTLCQLAPFFPHLSELLQFSTREKLIATLNQYSAEDFESTRAAADALEALSALHTDDRQMKNILLRMVDGYAKNGMQHIAPRVLLHFSGRLAVLPVQDRESTALTLIKAIKSGFPIACMAAAKTLAALLPLLPENLQTIHTQTFIRANAIFARISGESSVNNS